MARISGLAMDHSPSVAAALSPDVLVRQPPGTVSMLFHKVPVLQVPRAWRRVGAILGRSISGQK